MNIHSYMTFQIKIKFSYNNTVRRTSTAEENLCKKLKIFEIMSRSK